VRVENGAEDGAACLPWRPGTSPGTCAGEQNNTLPGYLVHTYKCHSKFENKNFSYLETKL